MKIGSQQRHRSRRAFLQHLVGAAVAMPLRLSLGGAPPRPRARSGIRHVVQIICLGGIDQVLTTSPRRVSDVAPGVDVPYADSGIIEAGGLQLGPHLAPLRPHAKQLTFVNGVRSFTAGHDTGFIHATRLRSRVSTSFPSLAETFGEYRTDTLVGALTMNVGGMGFTTPSALLAANPPTEDHALPLVEKLEPGELRALAASLDREASELDRMGDVQRVRMAAQLKAMAALYRAVPTLPPLKLEPWADTPVQRSKPLQQILWMLENDLIAGITVVLLDRWDTHEHNLVRQTALSPPTFRAIDRFLSELAVRKNAHGSLAAQTMLLVGSEMGRYPRLNARKGKDHSPELPFIIVDPERGGGRAYGPLGRELEALPVALETGGPGHAAPLRIDDLGSTLLRRLGISPEPHGYLGRELPFLHA